MGIETTRALQARRRESAARIKRLIARADERSPISSIRRATILDTARLARRQVRALSNAQDAVSTIEFEIGQTLLRIIGHGLSRNEAFELAGLRRHLGRRYLDLATSSPPPQPTDFSTDQPSDDATGVAGADLELNGDRPGAATPGRKL